MASTVIALVEPHLRDCDDIGIKNFNFAFDKRSSNARSSEGLVILNRLDLGN